MLSALGRCLPVQLYDVDKLHCAAEHRLRWTGPRPSAALTAQLRSMAQPNLLRSLVSAVLPLASAGNQPPTVLSYSRLCLIPLYGLSCGVYS